jgi:predicted RNA polymerase sigma factor
MHSYHLLPSVRGDLLVKLGRAEEARVEFERAATLSGNVRDAGCRWNAHAQLPSRPQVGLRSDHV